MSSVAVRSEVEKVIDNIVKSPEDTRLYRGLLLKNGMNILLISDVTTDKSAAALDVHIGRNTVRFRFSNHDYNNWQHQHRHNVYGAHTCESLPGDKPLRQANWLEP